MEWLLKDSALHFDRTIVDDGCLKQSGKKHRKLLKKWDINIFFAIRLESFVEPPTRFYRKMD